MRILFVPLDERPCNADYPRSLVKGAADITLVMPDKSILSHKKKAADMESLWAFVERELPSCDTAILSLDMLIYGGLLPSRLHHEQTESLLERVDRLYALHCANRGVKLYAFDCIMRVPAYDSSDEEPDYYADYGRRLFEFSQLTHRQALNILSPEESAALEALRQAVPAQYVEDYFGRREKNKAVTAHIIRLMVEGFFEQLVIPQDDSAVYGVQAMEQQEHILACKRLHIQNKVFVYPGADEVGLTLLSKAILDRRGEALGVFIRYGSLTGRFVVPGYEDRPYEETIKWQLLSAGLTITDCARDADIVLLVNVPGQKQYEADARTANIRENSSMRNLLELVRAAKYYISLGKTTALADVAYANGGDPELLELLKLEGVQDKIAAYAGWNTDANTLGTAICFAVVSHLYGVNRSFLLERYLEDCGYQSLIRARLRAAYDEAQPFEAQEAALRSACLSACADFVKDCLCPAMQTAGRLRAVSFPWKRLFEIGLEVEENEQINRSL